MNWAVVGVPLLPGGANDADSRSVMISTLRSWLYWSISIPFQSPAAPTLFPLPLVSLEAAPEGVKPAPTVSSASEVITTGKPGWPTTCRIPPMRSSMSSGRPVDTKPALPRQLDHQAFGGIALQQQAAVGVVVGHEDPRVVQHVHDVRVVPDHLGLQRLAADQHAVDLVAVQPVQTAPAARCFRRSARTVLRRRGPGRSPAGSRS